MARPWVIAALPPWTTGQPAPWPSAVSSSPKEAVNGAVSGSMEWAAVPARRARAESVVNPLATWRTEGTPARAKRARASGSLGMLRIGEST